MALYARELTIIDDIDMKLCSVCLARSTCASDLDDGRLTDRERLPFELMIMAMNDEICL